MEKESETIQPVTVPEDVSPEQVPTPAEVGRRSRSPSQPLIRWTRAPPVRDHSRLEPDESPSAVDPIETKPWTHRHRSRWIEPDAEPDAVPSVEPDAEGRDAEPGPGSQRTGGAWGRAGCRAQASQRAGAFLGGRTPHRTKPRMRSTETVRRPCAHRPGLATVKPTTVYRDPAGRFELGLGSEWVSTPRSISLRGTTFVTKDEKERAYVYVNPPSQPSHDRSGSRPFGALATYGETQTSFRVLVEQELDSLDGEIAYGPNTHTRSATRESPSGLSLPAGAAGPTTNPITRSCGRSNRMSATPVCKSCTTSVITSALGRTPGAASPLPGHLQGSLTPYVDPLGRFRISVPTLWPRTEVTADGSSTIFTEIGEKGYLTILVQPGATGITAAQIVSAWKEQWALEDGVIGSLSTSPMPPLSGQEGVRFDYAWSGGASGEWTRRLHATVVDDAFVVVALDYEAAGYASRGPVFDQIIRSFALIQEPEAAPERAARGVCPGHPHRSPTPLRLQRPRSQRLPRPTVSKAPGPPHRPPSHLREHPYGDPSGHRRRMLLLTSRPTTKA